LNCLYSRDLETSVLIKPKNLELAHHMEQIQIRQPKMPAAQSFIQILGTFLATLLIFLAAYFSYKKLASLNIKHSKRLI